MRHWTRHCARASTTLALWAACARPGTTPPPSSTPAPAHTEPELRIGVAAERPNVAIGGDGELILTDDRTGELIGSIPAGARWIAVPDGSVLRLVRPDGSMTDAHAGVFAVNVTQDRFAMADGHLFRGRLDIVRQPAVAAASGGAVGNGILIVNRVPLEGYVASVIAVEMGPRKMNEREALLAQAIVTRTRALQSRGRWEAQGVDAFADVRDQVYGGVASETEQSWEAARATSGLVLTYEGQLIDAYFHSTCGYSTVPVQEAFKTAVARPYLRSVSDAREYGGYFSDVSPRFQWREEWDGASLRSILSTTLAPYMNVGATGLPRITNIQVTGTTHSGRVSELRIAFDQGEVRIPGPDVRNVLRPTPDRMLGSAMFQLDVKIEGGEVTHLVATGVGWGHGVGFCQWGAIGRARAGADAARILAAYFPGTKIERLY